MRSHRLIRMLRTDRQGRRKSEPLSSRRSKNKPDTVRLFLAWPTAARDAPGPAKGGMVFFPLYGEKNTIPPFGKGRKSLFFFFTERKRTKKNPRAIAKIESLYPRLSRTAPRTQSALPVNRRARTVVRAFPAPAGNGHVPGASVNLLALFSLRRKEQTCFSSAEKAQRYNKEYTASTRRKSKVPMKQGTKCGET